MTNPPFEFTIPVTETHIASCRPGSLTNPISLALAEALGLDSVSVRRGPSTQPIADFRILPDSHEMMVTWNALLVELTPTEPPSGASRTDPGWMRIQVHDVPLPRRAAYFLSAWQYGPQSRIAIRGKSGVVLARRSYCEIIRPFTFHLTLNFKPGQFQPRVHVDDKEYAV